MWIGMKLITFLLQRSISSLILANKVLKIKERRENEN